MAAPQEYYDSEDLLFFLYVRSVLQQEIRVNFRSRWNEVGRGRDRSPPALFLSPKDCQQVSRVVFGSDDDPLYKRFMVMIDSNMIGVAKGAETPKIEVTCGTGSWIGCFTYACYSSRDAVLR